MLASSGVQMRVCCLPSLTKFPTAHCRCSVISLCVCVCVLPQLPATAVDPGPGSVELRALMRGSRCPVRFLRVFRQGGVAISDGRLHYVSP